MQSCWASPLGKCSTKLSGEHLVSGALFEDDLVTVQGLPWCREAPKTIGLANLTAKILCDYHNHELSPVDEAGVAAFKIFREISTQSNRRKQMTRGSWKVLRYQIDGTGLERWFLKTLINICYQGSFPIGRASVVAGQPTSDLVEVAYGHRRFERKAGLYSIIRTGMQISSTENFTFSPLLKHQHHIEGGLFSFRGFLYLLFLEPDGPPDPLDGVLHGGEDLGQCQLNFHNREISDKERGYLSQVVTVKW
jgi:hypothetical protein